MDVVINKHDLSLSDEVSSFIKREYERMERKDFFAFYPDKDKEELLSHSGFIYEARDKDSGELYAIIYLTKPEKGDEIAKIIKIDPLKLSHLRIALTKSEVRGQGLMKALMEMAEEDALSFNAEYICATVAPENIPSRNNFIKEGYAVKAKSLLYGGREREIMLKKIKNKDIVF